MLNTRSFFLPSWIRSRRSSQFRNSCRWKVTLLSKRQNGSLSKRELKSWSFNWRRRLPSQPDWFLIIFCHWEWSHTCENIFVSLIITFNIQMKSFSSSDKLSQSTVNLNNVPCYTFTYQLPALLTANWNVTVENVTSTSVSVFWINLEFLISEQVLHYITLLRSANGSSVLNAVITSGNTTSGNISGLSTYTEYQITIVGVRSDGQGHNSSKSTFWTEEGGKLHLTCQLRKFIVSFFIFQFQFSVSVFLVLSF